MNLALTRAELTYRFKAVRTRPVVQRDLAELASRIVIVTLFSSMAMRLATDSVHTGRVTGMLLVASEALVVALTLFRRSAGTVDRTWSARALTMLATFGPPLVRPTAIASTPDSLTVVVTALGFMFVVVGKMSLGRSFGLAPANRGVVSSGIYRFVRHPIYLGYLITHVGFVIANPSGWNLAVLAIADSAQLFRACREERTLSGDPAYREYMQRVRWRLMPGVF